jgi:hypothetical protein
MEFPITPEVGAQLNLHIANTVADSTYEYHLLGDLEHPPGNPLAKIVLPIQASQHELKAAGKHATGILRDMDVHTLEEAIKAVEGLYILVHKIDGQWEAQLGRTHPSKWR